MGRKFSSNEMLRIAIVCPSEIAGRRFLPALREVKSIEFAGVGVCAPSDIYGDVNDEAIAAIRANQVAEAEKYVAENGGVIFDSYASAATDESVDAVYIPLPPALHYKYASLALKAGKHVLVEKPATCSLQDTMRLIDEARARGLALHENYMFVFHDQIKAVLEIMRSGEIGDVRLYRIAFGFPRRAANDFRYDRELGGGALIDAGGYTLKLASLLLGSKATLKAASLNYIDGFTVDIFGSGTLQNESGQVAQVSFGMDNGYKCELEIWGSQGALRTNRILTAPVGFIPKADILTSDEERTISLPPDDAFRKSIAHFVACTKDEKKRFQDYAAIYKQAELVDSFSAIANQ